jgi:hypothetical protein
VTVGIGDVTDGELAIGDVAQETADSVDGVAARSWVVDGGRLARSPMSTSRRNARSGSCSQVRSGPISM